MLLCCALNFLCSASAAAGADAAGLPADACGLRIKSNPSFHNNTQMLRCVSGAGDGAHAAGEAGAAEFTCSVKSCRRT